MYPGFAGLLAIASLCSGTLVQPSAALSIKAPSINLNGASRGFLAEYLPLNLSMPGYLCSSICKQPMW